VQLATDPDPQGLVEHQGQHWRADERGLERVEFHLSANPGEPPRPLARIASGGEISRIMLVLKEIIAEQDRVSTLVFDEIDTGISGRIAAAVGKKLRALSASHQIIAITHLPQIASLAQTHFSVRKRQHQKRTITEVHLLDAAGRAEEIASLLAGETVSEAARQQAQELLR
jgi:DNA repair protein RecN (Recombination protein N)